jgi:sigma-B regulation protein RsbU (phosphoserine phosphatase)
MSTAAPASPTDVRGALPADFLPILAEISQQLAVSVDLERTLRESVGYITSYLKAEAAAVFMLEPAGLMLECRACVGPVDIQGLRIPADQGIVGRTVAQNACQMVRDARTDPDFSGQVDGETGFVTRSVLCAPLATAQGVIGAIEVINKRDGGLFDESDRDALRLLAAPTALALNIARMATELVEQNRIKRELTMARRLQRSLLPRRRRGPYPLRALNLPAREISGDFYDFFDLPDGRIAFAVGDVAGKGLDASFLMVRCASLLRWAGKEGLRPSDWVARVNDELGEAIAPGMFVCLVAGHYDPASKRAVWANAGFPPVLRVDAEGECEQFPAEGPPVGILRRMDFPEQETTLEHASLYLFSDGVTDVRDVHGQGLGVEGVEAIVRDLGALPPEPRLRALVRELRQLTVTDDTTLMLIEGETPHDAREHLLLSFGFPAQPQELGAMRHKLAAALAQAGVETVLRQSLVLAVDEACANIIRHAYGGACESRIELRLSQEGPEFRFELKDHAPCVDPSRVRPRDLDETRPGGLGINFIDTLMDSWSLQPLPERNGNILTMRKRIVDASGDEAGGDDA